MTREERVIRVLIDVQAQFQASLDEVDVDRDCKEAEEDNTEVVNALDEAIKALSAEPCEDCISRQYLLDNCVVDKVTMPYVPVSKIKNAPPATPQPKTGRWIYDYVSADGHRVYHCSECGCYLKPKHSDPLDSFRWCSHCGAKMVEPQESEEV